MQMNLRTNSQVDHTTSGLDWLLCLVVALEVPLYLGAAVMHLGVPIRLGPPPSPDWTLHYVMLAAIATVLALLLLRGKSKAEKQDAGQVFCSGSREVEK